MDCSNVQSSETLDCPILDVHHGNIRQVWPAMKLAIENSSFIAVDLELSGLGNRKKLASKCLDERYAEIKAAAESRAIISLGLSCFKLLDQDQRDAQQSAFYTVQTFNLLTLCSEAYTVEPQALKFLTLHGFDFNKQYNVGLSYRKGTIDIKDECYSEPSVRLLFRLLSQCNKPLVFHNGLIDLAFLYQNLYLNLPSRLSTFVADVEDLFPSGVYDTKYLIEYQIRLKASYLQYAFHSCLLWTNNKKNLMHVKFMRLPSCDDLSTVVLKSTKETDPAECKDAKVCQQYAAYGWCPKGSNCKSSHNVPNIVHEDLKKAVSKSSKKKRKIKAKKLAEKKACLVGSEESETPTASVNFTEERAGDEQYDNSKLQNSNQENSRESSGDLTGAKQNCHRAGVDAFMTGFCFACFSQQLHMKKTLVSSFKNTLYLSGKELPLLTLIAITDCLFRAGDMNRGKVLAAKLITPTVKWFKVKALNPSSTFHAGQWVDVFVPKSDLIGGYSMCSSPKEFTEHNTFDLAVKTSDFPPTQWMVEQCHVDCEFEFKFGGDVFFDPNPCLDDSLIPDSLILIAGGVGINPVYSILLASLELQQRKIPTWLFYSATSVKELQFKDQIDDVARENPSVNVQYFVTRQQGNLDGGDANILARRISSSDLHSVSERTNLSGSKVYLCGPGEMMSAVENILLSMQLKPSQISYEKWW